MDNDPLFSLTSDERCDILFALYKVANSCREKADDPDRPRAQRDVLSQQADRMLALAHKLDPEMK